MLCDTQMVKRLLQLGALRTGPVTVPVVVRTTQRTLCRLAGQLDTWAGALLSRIYRSTGNWIRNQIDEPALDLPPTSVHSESALHLIAKMYTPTSSVAQQWGTLTAQRAPCLLRRLGACAPAGTKDHRTDHNKQQRSLDSAPTTSVRC